MAQSTSGFAAIGLYFDADVIRVPIVSSDIYFR